MARYNSFKYGGAKYGTSATQDSLSWGLEIDWDNDGIYDGTNEASWMSRLHVKRGRDFFIRTDGGGYERVKVGEFVAELNNFDGRYDPYNDSSPLYPNVLPGGRFRLRVVNNNTGVIHSVLSGRITDIRPLSGGAEKVTIIGSDGLRELKDVAVSIGVSGSYPVESAVSNVLTDAGWTDSTNIVNTSEFVPYWWAEKSALDEVNDLADSVLGVFYVSASGTATFLTRNSTTESVETLSEDDVLRGIALLQPWDVIRNVAQVKINALTSNASVEIWRLRDIPNVAPGASIMIWPEFMYDNKKAIASSITTPVATTDYTMNTQSDGGGSNLTASFTVALTRYGTKARLVVTNNSGSTGYITLLKLRGTALTLSNSASVEDTNATSISRYQRRVFSLDNRWIQSSNLANSYASYLADYLSASRFFPSVRLKGNPAYQFTPDLFQRVTLNLPSKGVTGTYSLASIEHEWDNPLGHIVTTTFGFESSPDLSGNYWTFPTTLEVDSYFSF